MSKRSASSISGPSSDPTRSASSADPTQGGSGKRPEIDVPKTFDENGLEVVWDEDRAEAYHKAFCERFMKGMRMIKEGSFGEVYKSTDQETGLIVAVKVAKTVPFPETPDERANRLALGLNKTPRRFVTIPSDLRRELEALKKTVGCDNVVQYLGTNLYHYSQIYEVIDGMLGCFSIAMEYMPMDLHKYLYENDQLPHDEIRVITRQIVNGVRELHERNIFHRDLKPENILLDPSDLKVRITDLGMVRDVSDEHMRNVVLTPLVVTQFWRPIEVFLGIGREDELAGIDMWSVACIFLQMYNRGQSYFSGRGFAFVLDIVMKVGWPEEGRISNALEAYVTRMQNIEVFRKKYMDFAELKGVKKIEDIMSAFFKEKAGVPASAIEFVCSTLRLSPRERMSAEKALRLSYFKE